MLWLAVRVRGRTQTSHLRVLPAVERRAAASVAVAAVFAACHLPEGYALELVAVVVVAVAHA